MSELSVIIPAYRNLPEVMRCLRSLRLTAKTPVHFHVQDDATPEVNGHPELNMDQIIPPEMATVARNETNLTFPGNANAGARHAQGDILMITNQDIYAKAGVSDGWDAFVLDAFRDPTVGIVGPRLLFPDGRVQSAGGYFDARYQPTHRCLGWLNPAHPKCNTPGMVEWTTGAAFAVRRWLWESLGGFDEVYHGGYFEDVDFCVKTLEQGMNIWYEPRATLFHQVGTSGGNPHFIQNMRAFHERWVVSGKIEKLVQRGTLPIEGWW